MIGGQAECPSFPTFVNSLNIKVSENLELINKCLYIKDMHTNWKQKVQFLSNVHYLIIKWD